MSAVDEERKGLEESIKNKQLLIERLEESRSLLEALEERFPGAVYINSYYSGAISATFNLTVKDLAAEMSEHLTALEDLGLAVESWSTIDTPEDRRRTFYCSFSDTVDISVIAHLADDATCRIEVIGHKEEEKYEYVKVTRTVPVTQLVCA